MLSKSKYIRGANCHKSLWLYVHKKEEQAYSEATMAVFGRGINVGAQAQQYFPNGKLAVLEDYPGYASAKRTQEFIAQGVETIYEATFIFDDTLVAVDILHKENGEWRLYEVKSTNNSYPEYIKDVSIQYYVVTGSGLSLADAFLMNFDRYYVRRGAIEVNKLFTADSIKDKVLLLQEEIKNTLPILKRMLEGDEPIVEMGCQCSSPYTCDFTGYCKSLLPTQNEAPEIFSNTPEIKEAEVRKFVSEIQYPIAHLDFETIMPGVPLFDESRPYQQIPFQYSLHLQEYENGPIRHTHYLAECDINVDPRIGLIEQMIEETKEAKTILVYNITFERTRIKEMMRDFPQYAYVLENIIARMADLIIPFRRKYYHTESMGRRYGIKIVLPILCPELSYDELEIGEGMAASNAFQDLYYCTDAETIAKTREHLLAYCHLDTLGMVKIFEILKMV
ncbi:MAG: DUF2779 domain-containing protein [Bacteroidales bacterium]|nr:DUF2779 domain-containing protein [Bacteroidales bacterium]